MTDRRQKEKRFIHKLQHGFTMAELLIVVAIIGILAAFGFVNVYQYQKNLHLTELDNAAREIYVAAQNHLTVAEASGEWEDFYQTSETDSNGNVTQVSENDLNEKYGLPMASQPKDYKLSDFTDKTHHDFRYFVVGDESKKDLQDIILPKNAIDGSIMPSSKDDTHSIVIEYDAKTAVVYSVWYTDGKNGWFGSAKHYDIDEDDRKDGRPADKDDTSAKAYRHDHKPQIGYYGGGTRKETKGKVGSPKAEIVNADRLYVRVKYVNKQSTNSNPSNESVIIKVKGDISSKKPQVKNRKIQPVELNSVLKSSDSDLVWYQDENFKDTQNVNNAVYTCYMLDSVTDGRKAHFSKIFDNVKTGLIPGENITVDVYKVRGTEVKRQELHTNSLFQTISLNSDTGMYTADISYGRQLQNLSSDVSGVNQIDGRSLTARLTDNIDWNRFYPDEKNSSVAPVERNIKDNSESKYRYSVSLANADELDDAHKSSPDTGSYAFYSIYSRWLNEFDGNNKTIQNLRMQQEYHQYEIPNYIDHTGVGLFGIVRQNMDIHDLRMVNPVFEDDVKPVNAGVLIGTRDYVGNTLSIKNVNVVSDKNHELKINASRAGGVLAGYVRTTELTISDTHVKLNDGGSVNVDNGWAGGFIGLARDCSPINIENSDFSNSKDVKIEARANTDGQGLSNPPGSAAGLIGCIGNQYGSTTLSMNVNHVEVRATNDASISVHGTSHAGGIIGFMQENPEREPGKNIISDVHYDGGKQGLISVANNTATGYPRTAGGFIGFLFGEGLKISDSSTTTYVSVNANSSNRSSAGGFIGDLRIYDKGAAKTVIENCYYGGRVDNDGNYVNNTAFDNTGFHQGGYNVANLSDEGVRVSGGFIGQISRYWPQYAGQVNIQNCYTTGSVYISSLVKDSGSSTSAGGFIGLVRNQDDQSLSFVGNTNRVVAMSNTYATGKVSCGNLNDSKHIGAYIGTTGAFSIDSSSRNNYWLAGINEGIYGIGDNPWKNPNKNGSFSQVESAAYSADNQLIFGEASVNEAGTPFAVQEGQMAAAKPYSNALKDQKYPYTSVTSETIDNVSYGHVGDWPVVKAEKPKSFDHDFAVLYYEKVQHGYNKNSTNWYYHGYCVDATDTPSSVADYQEISTSNTLTSPGPLNNHGLLDAPGGNEYVAEDGYVILIADKYASKLDSVAVSNEWQRTKLDDAEKNGLLISYDNVLNSNKLNIQGYKAYFLNPDNGLYSQWNADKPFDFFIKGNLQDNNANDWKAMAEFHYLPVFADCLAPRNDQLPGEYVRSASQLNWLFSKSMGEKYIGNSGSKDVVTQTMDIDFSSANVDLTFRGEKVSYDDTPYFNGTMSGTYQGILKTDGTYTSLKNLTRPFINTIHSNPAGTLRNLTFSDFNSTTGGIVNTNYGTIQNITVKNSKVSDGNNHSFGLLVSGNNEHASASIDNCHLDNVTTSGNGLAGVNTDQSVIKDCTIKNSDISGNGVAETNNSNIKNCSIFNTTIKENGFTGSSNGNIEKGTLSNSLIGRNGFLATNTGNISDSSIVNAQIGKNGFVENQSNGTIRNCHIYGDPGTSGQGDDGYQTYLATYGENGKYHPNLNVKYNPHDQQNNPYGYELVTIGLNNDANPDDKETENSLNDYIGGFAGTVKGGTIDRCSVTGMVYGKNTGGFFGKANGQLTISNSYANTIVNSYEPDKAVNYAAGFGVLIENGGQWNATKINGNHALGEIHNQNGNGSGFIGYATTSDANSPDLNFDVGGANQTDMNYTAAWTADAKNYSYFFDFSNNKSFNKNNGNNCANNYYLIPNEITDKTKASQIPQRNNSSELISEISYEKLLKIASDYELAHQDQNIVTENAVKYGQYNLNENDTVYPFPMPVIETSDENGNVERSYMVQYGDWPDSMSDGTLAYIEYVKNGVANPYTYDGDTLTLNGTDKTLSEYGVSKSNQIEHAYGLIFPETVFDDQHISEKDFLKSLKAKYTVKENVPSGANADDYVLNFRVNDEINIPGYKVFVITNDDFDFNTKGFLTIYKAGESYADINLNLAKAIAPSGQLGSKEHPYGLSAADKAPDYNGWFNQKVFNTYKGKYFVVQDLNSVSDQVKEQLHAVEGTQNEYLFGDASPAIPTTQSPATPSATPTSTPTPTATPVPIPAEPSGGNQKVAIDGDISDWAALNLPAVNNNPDYGIDSWNAFVSNGYLCIYFEGKSSDQDKNNGQNDNKRITNKWINISYNNQSIEFLYDGANLYNRSWNIVNNAKVSTRLNGDSIFYEMEIPLISQSLQYNVTGITAITVYRNNTYVGNPDVMTNNIAVIN